MTPKTAAVSKALRSLAVLARLWRTDSITSQKRDPETVAFIVVEISEQKFENVVGFLILQHEL